MLWKVYVFPPWPLPSAAGCPPLGPTNCRSQQVRSPLRRPHPVEDCTFVEGFAGVAAPAASGSGALDSRSMPVDTGTQSCHPWSQEVTEGEAASGNCFPIRRSQGGKGGSPGAQGSSGLGGEVWRLAFYGQ